MRVRDQRPDQSEPAVDSPRPLSKIWLTIAFSYYGFMLIAFVFTPDAFAGITALPAIAWITLGLGLIFLTRLSTWKKSGSLLAKLFFVTGILTAEELYLPLRWLLHSRTGSSISYISLNCAGGDIRAAREAASRGAAVVFLQESPGKEELTALGKEFGYLTYWGVDGSILSRVSPKVDEVISDQDFVAIRHGSQVFVSLRLMPPQFRLDYWSPDLWQSQRENLVNRRAQLRNILDRINEMEIRGGDFSSIIVAGDINAIPSQIRAKDFDLHDLGSSYGVNWGGTAVNEYPLARIDRVWIKPDIFPEEHRVVTEKTKYSDHRMVVVYKE